MLVYQSGGNKKEYDSDVQIIVIVPGDLAEAFGEVADESLDDYVRTLTMRTLYSFVLTPEEVKLWGNAEEGVIKIGIDIYGDGKAENVSVSIRGFPWSMRGERIGRLLDIMSDTIEWKIQSRIYRIKKTGGE